MTDSACANHAAVRLGSTITSPHAGPDIHPFSTGLPTARQDQFSPWLVRSTGSVFFRKQQLVVSGINDAMKRGIASHAFEPIAFESALINMG
jgi:hypothetical protein